MCSNGDSDDYDDNNDNYGYNDIIYINNGDLVMLFYCIIDISVRES